MRAIITKKKPSAKPIRLYTIKESEFEDTLKEQTDYVKNYVQTRRGTKRAGDHFLIRDQKGKLEEVIFITEDRVNIWTFAALPKKLPLGDYEIANDLSESEALDAVCGWELGTYSFNKYKQEKCEFCSLVAPKNANMHEADIIVGNIELARDLINMPPSDLGPRELANAALEAAQACKARQAILHTDSELLQHGYEAIYTVGKGSAKRPKLVDIRWGNEHAPKVTIIGKGVTFDTGGVNLKPDSGMLLMKKDMAGAATALALGRMIMQAKINVNLRILIPTVENAVSGEAYRPSDVIKTRAGITVEVTNTDAEGRLILCEPLADADSEKPDLLIDFATLTGAARTAVGSEIGAFLTYDEKLAAEIMHHSIEKKDPLWQLPFWDDYKYLLRSKVADLVNSPETGNGGAITAALFLKEFVKKTKSWVHFDMMCWNTRERPGRPVGGEPMALRAMYSLIKKRYA